MWFILQQLEENGHSMFLKIDFYVIQLIYIIKQVMSIRSILPYFPSKIIQVFAGKFRDDPHYLIYSLRFSKM